MTTVFWLDVHIVGRTLGGLVQSEAASVFIGTSFIWSGGGHKYNVGAALCRPSQVPGDGNCLFHAISACLDHACNGTHPSLDLSELMPKSAALRKVRPRGGVKSSVHM